mmetsp:Transcript_64/g.302  ORF Transcript_64/g.302 Transcript_64/m.302 type:complete len:250 (+) Transcript_64:998-1747(+)
MRYRVISSPNERAPASSPGSPGEPLVRHDILADAARVARVRPHHAIRLRHDPVREDAVHRLHLRRDLVRRRRRPEELEAVFPPRAVVERVVEPQVHDRVCAVGGEVRRLAAARVRLDLRAASPHVRVAEEDVVELLGALLPLGLTADDGDGHAAAQRDRISQRGREQHHLDGLPDDPPGEDEVGLHRPLLATHDGGDARGLLRPVRDRLVGLQDAHVDRGNVLEGRHGYARDRGFFRGERPRRHSLDVV